MIIDSTEAPTFDYEGGLSFDTDETVNVWYLEEEEEELNTNTVYDIVYETKPNNKEN